MWVSCLQAPVLTLTIIAAIILFDLLLFSASFQRDWALRCPSESIPEAEDPMLLLSLYMQCLPGFAYERYNLNRTGLLVALMALALVQFQEGLHRIPALFFGGLFSGPSTWRYDDDDDDVPELDPPPDESREPMVFDEIFGEIPKELYEQWSQSTQNETRRRHFARHNPRPLPPVRNSSDDLQVLASDSSEAAEPSQEHKASEISEAGEADTAIPNSSIGRTDESRGTSRLDLGTRPQDGMCGNCGRQEQEERFLQCARCKAVVYCSRECQVQHWKSGHKASCKTVLAQQGGT